MCWHVVFNHASKESLMHVFISPIVGSAWLVCDVTSQHHLLVITYDSSAAFQITVVLDVR